MLPGQVDWQAHSNPLETSMKLRVATLTLTGRQTFIANLRVEEWARIGLIRSDNEWLSATESPCGPCSLSQLFW